MVDKLSDNASSDHKIVLDEAGTLHMADFNIPVSSLLSQEFKQAYIGKARASLASPGRGMPMMMAPEAEWDAFFSALHAGLSHRLSWLLNHYAVETASATIGKIPVSILTPRDGVAPGLERSVLINLHGGVDRGLFLGKIESIPIAALGGIKVVTIEYRQEPGHRYPASSEDVEAVYRELLDTYDPGSIGIFGSSFGGILAAQVVAWLASKGLPRPGAVGVLWAGLPAAPFPFGPPGDSKMWETDGIPHAKSAAIDSMMKDVAWFLENVSDDDPQAYPGSSDAVLADFPPTLFLSGTRSHDLSPSVTAHARLLRLGVVASLYVMEGAWHGASVMIDTPETKDARAYVARWLIDHLS